VLAGSCGGGERELTLGSGGVTGSGVLPAGHEQDRAFVEVAAPGIFLAVRMPLGTAVADARLAQLSESDRVTTGFGEEVAPVAEHVGPPIQAKLRGSRMLAQFPASRDKPLVMDAAAKCGDRSRARDGTIGKSRSADGLGGVFGDVVRHCLSRQRTSGAGQAASRWADDPGINLCPESQDTPQRGVCSNDRGRVVGDDRGGLADGLGQQRSCVPGWWWLAVRAGCVQADDRVVVDDAAGLVLGDFDEPDPHLLAQLLLGDAGQAGQLAGQVDGESAPQFRGAGIEQDVPGVVVAIRAHRLSEARVVDAVGARAGDVAAVRAASLMGITARPTGQLATARAGAGGVDRAEAGRGERGEHAWMLGNGVGHALAAGQPDADDLPGVVLVNLRAGRADVLAAVAAGDQEHATGLGVGVVHDAHLAGGAVDGIDAACQADRAGAVAGASELGFPAVEVVARGEVEQGSG